MNTDSFNLDYGKRPAICSAESIADLKKINPYRSVEIRVPLSNKQVRFTQADLNSAIIYLRDKDVITENNQFVIHLMRMWMQINRPFDRVREELTEINPIVS